MARPKPEFPDPGSILALVDGSGRLAVRVIPGARGEGLEVRGGKLQVKVRAKPKGGEANDAVIALVAVALGVAKSRVSLATGATSRDKLLLIAP